MLYLAVVCFLLMSVSLGENAISIVIGDTWTDYTTCDDNEWHFSNGDPAVYSKRRNGGEDLVDYCHYGEWGGDDTTGGMRYAFTHFTLINADNTVHTGPVTVNVEARIWAFCNYQSTDRVEVSIYDEYTGDLSDNAMKLDFQNTYTRARTDWSKGKRDNTCFDTSSTYNWDDQASSTMPDWLNEVTCTTLGSGVSCYSDIKITEEVSGGVLGLKFSTSMTETIDTAAWAFSNIVISFPPSPPEHCCTGNHVNKKKSCSSLHEVRNCENKGCDWNVENSDICKMVCCRYADPMAKDANRKPKCKNINYYFPDRSECEGRLDCTISQCDRIGQMDGILNP